MSKVIIQAGHEGRTSGSVGALSNEYVAGFLDGEGWFRISRDKGRKSPRYQVIVGASSTDDKILKLLVKKYGGKIYKRVKRKGWKPEYQYHTSCRNSENLIKQIIPFLILKKERAEKCLVLLKETKQSHGVQLSNETLKRRNKLFSEMKKLNQRGVAYA